MRWQGKIFVGEKNCTNSSVSHQLGWTISSALSLLHVVMKALFLRNISRHVCISSSAEINVKNYLKLAKILLQVSHNRFIIPPLLFDVYRHIHGWSLETWKLCGMRIYVRGFPCNLPERETKWKAIFILLFFLFVHASFLWFSLKMKLFFRRI